MVEEIKKLIDEMFGDMSVSKRETVDRLCEIQNHMDSMINTLEMEIERDEGMD